MNIAFVLPAYYDYPIGGYRVHFEHANRLATRGHRVTVYLPWFMGRISSRKHLGKALLACWKLRRVPDCGLKWFAFTGPRLRVIPDLRAYWLRAAADVVIATGWQTADFVARLPERFGRKFYSIWDYELYMAGGEEVRSQIAATYRLGLIHIAPTEAINKLVTSLHGSSSAIVGTGIDFEVFSQSESSESPKRRGIGFAFREEIFKRSVDALSALEQVRANHPNLDIWSFGRLRPPNLPKWVNYHVSPSDHELSKLYNRTMIFVCSSQYEGWGLPGSEAMACGAALVSTSTGGVDAYAKDGVTALIVPVRNPDALATAVQILLEDPSYRHKLATNGASSIRQFNWNTSTDKFERELLQA